MLKHMMHMWKKMWVILLVASLLLGQATLRVRAENQEEEKSDSQIEETMENQIENQIEKPLEDTEDNNKEDTILEQKPVPEDSVEEQTKETESPEPEEPVKPEEQPEETESPEPEEPVKPEEQPEETESPEESEPPEETEPLEPEELITLRESALWGSQTTAVHNSANYNTSAANMTPADENYSDGLTLRKNVAENSTGEYEITLGVKSSSNIHTSSNKADIVLVLDTSGSMDYNMTVDGETMTRMEYLQDAADNFVSDIAEGGYDARIAIATFSSIKWGWDYWQRQWVITRDAAMNRTNGLLNASTSKDTLKSIIDGLEADGGTHTDEGIKMAQTIINNDNQSDRQKFVILFTDGEPTGSNTSYPGQMPSWDANVVANSKTYAQQLKTDYQATVFTIGLFSETSNNERVDSYMKALSSENKEGNEYYYKVSDTLSLSTIFKTIEEEMGTKLEDALIKDYIDPDFVLTRDSKNALLSQGAVIGEENGATYVAWRADIYPVLDGDGFIYFDGITVVPKDDSVWGDVLPTNKSGISGVTTADGMQFWEFPKPTVCIPQKYGLELTITKNIDKNYSTFVKPNHNQSFIYKIDHYDTASSEKPVETFYAVISFSNSENVKEKSEIISIPEKGWYSVAEMTQWSWKYKENEALRADTWEGNNSIKEEGSYLPIGTRTADGRIYGMSQGYSGGIKAEVYFANELKAEDEPLGDVAGAVNEFTGEGAVKK